MSTCPLQYTTGAFESDTAAAADADAERRSDAAVSPTAWSVSLHGLPAESAPCLSLSLSFMPSSASFPFLPRVIPLSFRPISTCPVLSLLTRVFDTADSGAEGGQEIPSSIKRLTGNPVRVIRDTKCCWDRGKSWLSWPLLNALDRTGTLI